MTLLCKLNIHGQADQLQEEMSTATETEQQAVARRAAEQPSDMTDIKFVLWVVSRLRQVGRNVSEWDAIKQEAERRYYGSSE